MMTYYKSFLLLIIFTISFLQSSAQRLKDDPVKIKYVKLPGTKLPDDYKTYSVKASGVLFSSAGGSNSGFEKSITMPGFKKLVTEAGHIRVTAYGGEPWIGNPVAKTRTTTSKKDDGTKVTTTYYYYELPARCRTSYRVYDHEGNVLKNNEYNNEETIKTRESTSRENAKAKIQGRNLNTLRSSYKNRVVSGLRGGIGKALSSYTYQNIEDRYNIYLIKKHASEERWIKHYETLKKVYGEASHYTSAEELKGKLQPALEFYEKEGSKDPKGDKKLKRIYKAANYNAAIIYWTVDEFEKCRTLLEKVIKSEKKDRRSNAHLDKMDVLRKRMENNDTYTLHYERKVDDAMGPATIQEIAAEEESVKASNNVVSGYIMRGEEKVDGEWQVNKDAEDLIFGEGGNVKFVASSGDKKELDVTAEDISAFELSGRNFVKKRFVPSAQGAEGANVEILEEVYSSERIKLFKYYPSTGALSNDKIEFAFQKSGQENPISLEDTMFLLWKKGVAKYFADCPDLSEMAAEGGVEKTKDSLIKAARVYSELCDNVIKP